MAMDVTPQELREVEIREAWRGYHRDDVDELLERAAATIEHLAAQVQQLQTRGPAAAPAPAPVAAPVPAAPPRAPEPARPAVDPDVIQRTLLLAQRAADEAVAEAQARSQQMLQESEAKAQQLVSDAEAAARRIAESERRRIEAEIVALGETRELLQGDVDALEQFEREHRERIRRAIETDLELLGSTGVQAAARPRLSGVELPPGLQPELSSGPPTAAIPAVTAAPARPEPIAPPAPPEPIAPPAPPAAPVFEDTAGAPEPRGWEPPRSAADWSQEPGWGEALPVEEAEEALPVEEVEEALEATPAPAEPHALDDDAFFASLREAVRDEAPLGEGEPSTFFDQDESDEERRGIFRRKR